jgi:hypothetical protein
VAPMQNTEASVALAGVPRVTGPAAMPFSVIVTQRALPKQPAWGWPVQKMPFAAVTLAVPVESGERLMGITPTCEPSQQLPPPGAGGAAVATEETKTTAPSATAAAVTTTLLPIVVLIVIVESPCGRSLPAHIGPRPPPLYALTRLSMRFLTRVVS